MQLTLLFWKLSNLIVWLLPLVASFTQNIAPCKNFQTPVYIRPCGQRGISCQATYKSNNDEHLESPIDDADEISNRNFLLDRRQACLASLGLAVCVSQVPSSSIALDANDGVLLTPYVDTDTKAPDLNCLSDLPPIPSDCVRLFLCRHGQTENNRLKLIQGARIDPPLNDNGLQQAPRLGQALARAPTPPQRIFHSSLLRARQTAQLASQQFTSTSSTTTNATSTTTTPPLTELPALAEIDFGGVLEGVPVTQVRASMVATYSSWGVGVIDTRMAEDSGESFTMILSRIQSAVASLVEAAQQSETRAVAAVAHSTYNRMFLAVLNDWPLLQTSTIDQKNCCVNVIDISTTQVRALGPKSNLLGGKLSQAPANFSCQVPLATALRVGEQRHLGDLAL